MRTQPELKTGCLAYFDTTTCGLVPCRVLAIYPDKEMSRLGCGLTFKVDFEVTEDRGAFKKGYIGTDGTYFVIPRDSVQTNKKTHYQTVRKYKITPDSYNIEGP